MERRDEQEPARQFFGPDDGALDQQRAIQVAREVLTNKGLYRVGVGANASVRRLLHRFRFPPVALAEAAREIGEVDW